MLPHKTHKQTNKMKIKKKHKSSNILIRVATQNTNITKEKLTFVANKILNPSSNQVEPKYEQN